MTVEGRSTKNWALSALRRSTAPRESRPASISGWSAGTCRQHMCPLSSIHRKQPKACWSIYDFSGVFFCKQPHGRKKGQHQVVSGWLSLVHHDDVSSKKAPLVRIMNCKKRGRAHLCAHDGACSCGHDPLNRKDVRCFCSGLCSYCASIFLSAGSSNSSGKSFQSSNRRLRPHELSQNGRGFFLCRQQLVPQEYVP